MGKHLISIIAKYTGHKEKYCQIKIRTTAEPWCQECCIMLNRLRVEDIRGRAETALLNELSHQLRYDTGLSAFGFLNVDWQSHMEANVAFSLRFYI
jgi:hypothetical protein